MKIAADEDALRHLAKIADGDARKALNALEIAALTTDPRPTASSTSPWRWRKQCIQKKAVVYDGDGDAHYDTISAFIKSMRGSDVDAALYWLAKMIHAGEDPRFITRRILICAAEDVGLADPMALVLAIAAHHAAEFVGWPEAHIPIAEAAIYIATANKSNSACVAIDAALEDVRSGRTLPVPEHLRDAHYAGAKRLGHGEDYKYAHDFPGHFVAQDYLGAARKYYEPSDKARRKKSRSGWKNGANNLKRCAARPRPLPANELQNGARKTRASPGACDFQNVARAEVGEASRGPASYCGNNRFGKRRARSFFMPRCREKLTYAAAGGGSARGQSDCPAAIYCGDRDLRAPSKSAMSRGLRAGEVRHTRAYGPCARFPLKHLDLALVPGVGFDVTGHRLGRGRGFYDRLLAEFSGIKCGVAFDHQFVAQIPAEKHDVRMNCILTPTRWLEIPGQVSFLT